MGLQRICLAGLRESHRLSTIQHFEGFIAGANVLRRSMPRIVNYKSVAFLSCSRSPQSCTFSELFAAQPTAGPLSHTPLPAITAVRSYSKANMSEDSGHLVYRGRVQSMFKKLKIFSLVTSAFGLTLQPYLWYTMQDVSLMATVPLFAAVNMFVFTNPILIHFLSKRYVNELYFNPKSKEFTAMLLTFFARKETFKFTAADVTVPDMPGMFSMLTARDRPLFVDERDFTSVEVYKHLMGFDRPLDLRHLSNPSRQQQENE